MICESCGAQLDLFDDAIDGTEVCDDEDVVIMETKITKYRCFACGHIQYSNKANIGVDLED
jgi:hypothetical protein